ncbi:Spc7 kinetochore protein-domain-containing protein [Gautieria morchelliformis]|nr:Spc7 kinetochore protein-domain-containing protein [Gautieria morchelliformis]
MTGIRFMDDMTCPRRSTVHPSQLQRRESNDKAYSLSDYAVAMTVDVSQLETISWIVNDIRSAIDKYKAQYRETEEDAAKDIPFLFREYVTASEEDREQILYVLKLIKAHTILSAKASWYEWKRGWVQGLLTNAERALDNLDADECQLVDIATRAEQTLPGLRTEFEEITRELEREKAAVAEIENCDQTFLSELKATIAEQRQELDVYRTDIADGNTKLARLEETLEDLEDQARDAKTAITTAQRQMDIQETSTRAEVFRLRDELNNLQDLHLWRAVQLSAEMVEFVYDSKYRVSIPCRRYSPIPETLDIVPFEDQSHISDDFPLVTELMYRIARRRAIQSHDKLTLRMIVQRLTDFWAAYAQLRWQLNFIVIKYPLSFQLMPTGSGVDDAEGFKATASLLLFRKTSKALISFHIGSELLNGWPLSMDLLKFDVAIAYGKADPIIVGEALRTRLAEASAAENHACLVDACMEVVSRYS